MDVREYMFRHRLSAPQMAKLIGCSRSTIAHLKYGGRAGKWLASEIERITNGEITKNELRLEKVSEKALEE